MNLDGKHIVILGLARSGAAAARFALGRGARVTINDVKPAEKLPAAAELEAEGVRVIAGGHPAGLFEGADLVIVSPGIPADAEPVATARARGLAVVGEVEFASWFLRGRMVGVTGTNGKTTTTTLIGEILRDGGIRTLVGGNIGTPLISLVEQSSEETWAVVELSSFQLEVSDAMRVHRAVVLNITPDHLDRHKTMEGYVAAKRRIMAGQRDGDLAILNADDPVVAEFADVAPARVSFFSAGGEIGNGVCRVGDSLFWRAAGHVFEEIMPISEVPLFGEHNLENVCAALAVGRDLGVPHERMRATVRAFRGVEHRIEPVTEIAGVAFFNDSKATNTDAAIKAIEAFDGRPGMTVLIVGGQGKGQDFTALAGPSRDRVRHAVLIGEAAGEIGAALEGVCRTSRAGSMAEAVHEALERAETGDRVLLAPACASFDMFEDYEHRGRTFKEEVHALARTRG